MPYITFKNENALYHAEKGSTWSNHKYIRIENGRYIYPEDLEGNSGSTKGSSTASGAAKTNIKADQAAKAKAAAQYQIDYIKDIKKDFDSKIQYNNEEIAYYKDSAEKIFNKNKLKKPSISDLSKKLKGLEDCSVIAAESAGIYLLDIVKDNKLSEETKAACAKYVMQKMLSEFATISSTYRDIVNKTKDGSADEGEKISKNYKEFKELYEKVSNANSFSREDLDEFDNIIRTNMNTDWAKKK